MLAVMVTFPLDGSSLNPMRALATAVVGSARHTNLFQDMELFIFGPIVGGILIGLLERFVMENWRKYADEENVEGEGESYEEAEAACSLV